MYICIHIHIYIYIYTYIISYNILYAARTTLALRGRPHTKVYNQCDSIILYVMI